MYNAGIPILGTFESAGRPTAAGGTAFAHLIPPFMGGPGRSRFNFQTGSPKQKGGGVAHIEKIIYTTGATAHLLTVMRPLNFTTASSAAAKNQAVINLTADPGVYSTNYAYDGVLSTGTAQIADNAIAAGDYCAYQLVDGTWVVDTVSSVATLAITMTTVVPNVTGGGVAAGAPFYFFGVVTDKDPATGQLSPQTTIAASQTRDASWASSGFGIVSALHEGDPLIFYSPNGTNAGFLEALFGYYAKF